MILSNWPLEKHFPGIFEFQALSRCGLHCRIHTTLSTTLLIASIKMARYKGRMNALVIVMRSRNRQIEILVNVNVAKVYEAFREDAPSW